MVPSDNINISVNAEETINGHLTPLLNITQNLPKFDSVRMAHARLIEARMWLGLALQEAANVQLAQNAKKLDNSASEESNN